jgi:hypothetical protein
MTDAAAHTMAELLAMSPEERFGVLSNFTPAQRMTMLVEKECCQFCFDETPESKSFCSRDKWYTMCVECSRKMKVCPQCRNPKCTLPVAGNMKKGALQALFSDGTAESRRIREAFEHMNDTMYLRFEARTLFIGVEEYVRESEGPTRGRTEASAFVKGNEGNIALDIAGEHFVGWSVALRTLDAFPEETQMVRTVLHEDGVTRRKQRLGPARPWLRALLWGETKKYLCFVGVTNLGGYIECIVSFKPELPGGLLLAGKTLEISAVDIPSSVWRGTPTFNDERTLFLGSDVRNLNWRLDGGSNWTPARARVDDSGCLIEEFADLGAGYEQVKCAIQSLKGELLSLVYGLVEANGSISLVREGERDVADATASWATITKVRFDNEEGEQGDVLLVEDTPGSGRIAYMGVLYVGALPERRPVVPDVPSVAPPAPTVPAFVSTPVAAAFAPAPVAAASVPAPVPLEQDQIMRRVYYKDKHWETLPRMADIFDDDHPTEIYMDLEMGVKFVLSIDAWCGGGHVYPVYAELDANGSWDVRRAMRESPVYVDHGNSCKLTFEFKPGDSGVVSALVEGLGSNKVISECRFLPRPPRSLSVLSLVWSVNYMHFRKAVPEAAGTRDAGSTVFRGVLRARFELTLTCPHTSGYLFPLQAELDADGRWAVGAGRRLPPKRLTPGSSHVVAGEIGRGSHGVVIALMDGTDSEKVLHQFRFLPVL